MNALFDYSNQFKHIADHVLSKMVYDDVVDAIKSGDSRSAHALLDIDGTYIGDAIEFGEESDGESQLEDAATIAIRTGMSDVYKEIISRGIRGIKVSHLSFACKRWDMDMVKFWLDNYKCSPVTFNRIIDDIENGLISLGETSQEEWFRNFSTLLAALKNIDIDPILYLDPAGVNSNDIINQSITFSGMQRMMIQGVIDSDRLDLVELVNEYGWDFGINMNIAAENGSIDIVEYLWNNGHRFVNITLYIDKHKKDMRRWLESHGCKYTIA
jgi:hypothetical protein